MTPVLTGYSLTEGEWTGRSGTKRLKELVRKGHFGIELKLTGLNRMDVN